MNQSILILVFSIFSMLACEVNHENDSQVIADIEDKEPHFNEVKSCQPLNFDDLLSQMDSTIQWNTELSNEAKGMLRTIETPGTEKVIFLTFDACGQGGLSDGYDSVLVRYLIEEQIPTTFFISRRWALKKPQALNFIIENGNNIDIQNHGTQHIPLSSVGSSIYEIKGTTGMKEVYDEVEISSDFFCSKLGRRPKLFRPGTAYSDEMAVHFANKMGYEVISYSVLGDAGATFKRERIKQNILDAQDGDIILMHFNHPESEVFLGVKDAIEELNGSVKFGLISDFI